MGKRIHDLYPQVYAFENLLFAERDAAHGKRGRPDVAAFEYSLEEGLLTLQQELREKTYRPGAYRRHTVCEPKERLISAAPYRDRVVHHALTNVIEPIFERRFIKDSYASRGGKGTHAALDRCQTFARHFPYVLRCDIVEFFPAMDHAVLRGLLTRVIGDDDLLWLCDTLLTGGADELTTQYTCVRFAGDTDADMRRPRGLPIGNQTSQFWANVYLNALDQYIKRDLRCAGYVRYVDDFLLFAPDKSTLHAWKRAIIAFLATLRLTLHEAESAVIPVMTGIPFLGFRVYPDHRRLRHRNVTAFARRYRRLRGEYTAGRILFTRLDASVQGWVAHAAHADTFGLRRSLLEPRITAPAIPFAMEA